MPRIRRGNEAEIGGRRQVWLRECNFLEYLCFSTITKTGQLDRLPRICEPVRLFGPRKENNNGPNASERWFRGPVIARAWTV